MRPVDLTGMKFGKWYVISRSDRKTYWNCRCDCGTLKEVFHSHLKNEKSTSCGCFTYPHHHPAYTIWHGIKVRCYCRTSPNYKIYGAKGIRMCKEWKNDPWSFLNWADSSGFKPGLSIERLDCFGNYNPENCTWIPREEQNWNKMNTFWVRWNRKKISLGELVQNHNLIYQTVFKRLRRGWTLKQAILGKR